MKLLEVKNIEIEYLKPSGNFADDINYQLVKYLTI
jgi:hypothetical protein